MKNSTSVKITSLVNHHNHDCTSTVSYYAPKYRHLSPDILEDIKFFTLDGHMGARIQYRLLTAKYPDIYIYKRDLYNAIYRFKATSPNQRQGDGQSILNKLLELQQDEPGWIIKTRLEGPDNRLVGLFWMNPIQVQLLIQYRDVVICDNTCKTNWYDMYLSLLIIVDNNTRTRLVCQGLSEDETSGSYQWFFQCL